MIRPALLGALLLFTAAAAQPAQPMPTASTPVAVLLASAPHIDISNGLVTARIAPPDSSHGFYRGTRFDQAGVVTSLRLGAREFYGPWFDATAPEILDYAYDATGQIVAGPDSAISGPVEEFAPAHFRAQPHTTFLKIGVGFLSQPDDKPYDHYRHYPIVDAGQRSLGMTADSVAFSQRVTDGEWGYVYEKTLRLVPHKPELLIEHRLRNIGKQPIETTVYDHNFLRLAAGDAGIKVTFPFSLSAANPPPADLIRIQDKTLTYLRPMAPKERVSFPVTGFGNTAADYDIAVEDMADGAGVHITGDQPLTKINIFSIDRVQSVEPYIAIDLAPGAERRWSYRYSFRAVKK